MITFNNKPVPGFVRVKRVDVQTLPSVTNNLRTIAGGFGTLLGTTTFGEKVIKVEIVVVQEKGKSLQAYGRELAVWLCGDNHKLSDLVIEDDPTVKYLAKVNNSVDLSDVLVAGEGSIEFVVPSGLALSINEISKTGTGRVVFDYTGTHTGQPIVELTLGANATVFTLADVKTGDRVVINGDFVVGDKIIVDCDKHLARVNGLLDLSVIGFDSKFIELGVGQNEISCSVPNTAINVTYRERYL